MKHARGRKHYRAANKVADEGILGGLFIPEKQRKQMMMMAILFMIIAFLKGMIIGYMLAKHEG